MSAAATTFELSISANTDLVYLSASRCDELVEAIQSAPCDRVVDTVSDPATGEETQVERFVYRAHPAADRALEELLRHFLPLIHSMARKVSVSAEHRGLTAEDAFGFLSEAFIDFARNRYTPGQLTGNFVQLIKGVLSMALLQRERDSHLIRIPGNAMGRYSKHMRDHDMDENAAHASARKADFDPYTFLQVINAISAGNNSLDQSQKNAEDDGDLAWSSALFRAGAVAPDPADEVVQTALVAYAFSVVSPEMEIALRLKFLFDDETTLDLIDRYDVAADKDGVMRTVDVNHILRAEGILTAGRSTLDRHLVQALLAMREALEASGYNGVSGRSVGL